MFWRDAAAAAGHVTVLPRVCPACCGEAFTPVRVVGNATRSAGHEMSLEADEFPPKH